MEQDLVGRTSGSTESVERLERDGNMGSGGPPDPSAPTGKQMDGDTNRTPEAIEEEAQVSQEPVGQSLGGAGTSRVVSASGKATSIALEPACSASTTPGGSFEPAGEGGTLLHERLVHRQGHVHIFGPDEGPAQSGTLLATWPGQDTSRPRDSSESDRTEGEDTGTPGFVTRERGPFSQPGFTRDGKDYTLTPSSGQGT